MKELYNKEQVVNYIDNSKAYRMVVRSEGRYHDIMESYFIVNGKCYKNFRDVFNVGYVLGTVKPTRIPSNKRIFQYSITELTNDKLYNFQQYTSVDTTTRK